MLRRLLNRFKVNFFYISFSRLFFFFVLANMLFISIDKNVFICSYLIHLSSSFSTSVIINSFYILFLIIYLFKVSFFKSMNVLNKFIISEYLILNIFLTKSIKSTLLFELKYLYNYIFIFLNFLLFYFNYKHSISVSKIVLKLFYRYYSWFPLYKKISYFGYYRSFRSYNALDYERNICNLKK